VSADIPGHANTESFDGDARVLTSGVLLEEVRLPPPESGFPFDLPLLRGTRSLAFDRPVTVIVGENGSGKRRSCGTGGLSTYTSM
jgi:hypothetical protein